MDELEVGKREKRSRRVRRRIHREQYKDRISSQKATATNVVRYVNKTQKLYEKQSSRRNITNARITTRPGLFNQGRCTSFVQRVLNISPEKKARMDEDLHRIIQLANGVPVKHPNATESFQNEDSRPGKSSEHFGQEIMDICEDATLSRDIDCLDHNKKIKRNKSYTSMQTSNGGEFDHPRHENAKKKEKHSPCEIPNKPLCILSSSSSNESSSSSSLESVRYCNPSLDVYEEFADAIVSSLNAKMTYLFPGRDYLQETRARIRTKYNHNQMNNLIHHMDPKDGWNRTAIAEFQKGNQLTNDLCSGEPKSPSPVMVDQAVGTSVQIETSRHGEEISDVYSPIVVTLSPRTTILNPIEFLKRVEKANKKQERRSNDSGHETGHSRDSNISNSQNKTHLSHGSQDNSDSFHYLSEPNDGYRMPLDTVPQKLIYQHSNRSYIDSPQAFELKEGNYVVSQRKELPLSMNPFHRELNYQQNRVTNPQRNNMIRERKMSNFEVEQNKTGFQYLMDVSEVSQSNIGFADCSDLLDDLDAADCNLITDSTELFTAMPKRKGLRKFTCSFI